MSYIASSECTSIKTRWLTKCVIFADHEAENPPVQASFQPIKSYLVSMHF